MVLDLTFQEKKTVPKNIELKTIYDKNSVDHFLQKCKILTLAAPFTKLVGFTLLT